MSSLSWSICQIFKWSDEKNMCVWFSVYMRMLFKKPKTEFENLLIKKYFSLFRLWESITPKKLLLYGVSMMAFDHYQFQSVGFPMSYAFHLFGKVILHILYLQPLSEHFSLWSYQQQEFCSTGEVYKFWRIFVSFFYL